VRVVLVTLRRQETPLRFRMFPMLHIGRPEFYREVRARVERCDLAVVEGVGRSSAGSSLTLSYRLIPRNRRHGLVEQDIGPNTLDIPVINPDLNGEEVDAGWRRVPAWQRATLRMMAPVVGLTAALRGPDWRHATTDDVPSPEDEQFQEQAPELANLINDSRDRRLVQALVDIHEERSAEDIDVAVVYGAGHMGAVVHALLRSYRYIPGDAEFLTVVD
jgi:hypothetical protein